MKPFRPSPPVRLPSEQQHSAAGDDPAPGSPTEGRTAVLWEIQVSSLLDFFSAPPFRRTLTAGLTFIHNKRPSADRLLEAAQSSLGNTRTSYTRASDQNLTSLVDALVAKRRSRAVRPQVLVLDVDLPGAPVEPLVRACAGTGHLRRGLWMRSYVEDLQPTTLQLFDLMFLFDMDAAQLEKMRSTIPLPLEVLEDLRPKHHGDSGGENVLIFTAATDRSGARVPQVRPNPVLLPIDGTVAVPRRYTVQR